ncbi:MAG: Adenylate cyclase, partial [uncultured Solirubrobacteraceae bacterium]
ARPSAHHAGGRQPRGRHPRDAEALGAGRADSRRRRLGVVGGGGGARTDRRAAARSRALHRADPHRDGRGAAGLRLHRGSAAGHGRRADVGGGGEGDGSGGRADHADLRRDGVRRPDARADLRRGPAVPALRRRGARGRVPADRVPAAVPRLRPGTRADRRRRGPPVPPLRPRAADARGRPRPGDGRGDGGSRARAHAAGLADHGPRPPALPAALRRAGRHRPHGDGSRRHAARSGSPARGDRLRRPRGLHAADRGAGGGGGRRRRGALRRGGRAHAARGRARGQDDRRRGDGCRRRRRGPRRLGGRVPTAAPAASAAAHRRALRRDALPRRGLLRARGEPRRARRRALRRRGGRRHAPARRPLRPSPRVRADRRGAPEGLRGVDGALPGAAGRGRGL